MLCYGIPVSENTPFLEEITLPLKELLALFSQELTPIIENKAECHAIIQRLLHYYFQIDATHYILNPLLTIVPTMQAKLLDAIDRLKKHEPIQYIIGEAYFAGNSFKVTPAVLIPRPETEEWITFLRYNIAHPTTILDVGTGSGCMAITLKKYFPEAVVDALDISTEALKVACYNAEKLGVAVNFIATDILNELLPPRSWSLIVSNPPYVRVQEKKRMHANVLDYEPHLALFVDDDDPLLFYRHIIYLAGHHLNPNGTLCLEINEAFGKKIVDLLHHANFRQITLYKDIHEKERWIMAML